MSIPILTEVSCLLCHFQVHEKQGDATQMFCRRLPPKPEVIMVPTPKGPMPGPVLAVFPPVQAAMWCGEFKRRIHHAHAGAVGSAQRLDG